MSKNMIKCSLGLLAVGCMLAMVSVAGAGMITYEHLDDNNPTTEGWTMGSGFPYTVGPDAGPPLNWKITCGSHGSARYIVNPTATEFADPLGWTSTVRMQYNVGIQGGQRNTVLTGSLNLGWTWDDDVDGNPLTHDPDIFVSGMTTGAFGLGGAVDPTDGFHYYQIVYNPAGAGTVTWYLDGASVHSAAPSELNTHLALMYYFGDGDGSTGSPPSDAQWALARLESGQHPIIPEPGTLALLATGLIGLLCYAWRKRK